MTISYVPAHEDDAAVIASLRQRIWDTTYRGIYPDEVIDHFDFPWHTERNLQWIRSRDFHVYLIKDDDRIVGYLIFQHQVVVHLQSLYLLPEFQHRGIGAMAFHLLRDYCTLRRIDSFTCFCQPQNSSAAAFYAQMGGIVIASDTGHENPQEDQITYRFSC